MQIMPSLEIIVKILGSWFLVLSGAVIKILADYMQDIPVPRKYPPLRLFLSFLIWCLLWRAGHIAWYQPFLDYRPFLILVAIGISLDIILKDLPKKIYSILSRIREAIIKKEIPK